MATSIDSQAQMPGYERFLQEAMTIASIDRDFKEWHGGIAEYGVWAVIIEDADWLACWQTASIHLDRFLHTDYRRQPHITIATCGLMHERHFNQATLDRQIALLEDHKPPIFMIESGRLNSFSTAPYIEIHDAQDILTGLSTTLGLKTRRYVPHLTVGFYRDAYRADEVAERLAAFAPWNLKFEVRELHFCTYETHDIKGRLEIRHRIRLGDCNK